MVNGSSLTGSPPLSLAARVAMAASAALAAQGKTGVNATSLGLGGTAISGEAVVAPPSSIRVSDSSALAAGLAAGTLSMAESMRYGGSAAIATFVLSAVFVAFVGYRSRKAMIAKLAAGREASLLDNATIVNPLISDRAGAGNTTPRSRKTRQSSVDGVAVSNPLFTKDNAMEAGDVTPRRRKGGVSGHERARSTSVEGRARGASGEGSARGTSVDQQAASPTKEHQNNDEHIV